MSSSPAGPRLRRRSPAARLLAFAFALVAAFGGGVAIGRAVGPLDDPTTNDTSTEVPGPDPRPAPTHEPANGEHP